MPQKHETPLVQGGVRGAMRVSLGRHTHYRPSPGFVQLLNAGLGLIASRAHDVALVLALGRWS